MISTTLRRFALPRPTITGLLPSQGGGHGNLRSVDSPDPLVAKPFNAREYAFYSGIQPFALRAALPCLHGACALGGAGYLLLEDLTHGLISPCVGDFKLGTRSFEVGAPPAKEARQFAHTVRTTTRSHAVRLVDVAVRRASALVDRWNRREGRRLSPRELRRVLRYFLSGDRLREFVSEIDRLSAALSSTLAALPNLRLYSASVLVVYDGDRGAPPLRAALIDFAHAYLDIASEGVDPSDDSFADNAVAGLANLRAFALSGQPFVETKR
jgi:hypothetical protein